MIRSLNNYTFALKKKYRMREYNPEGSQLRKDQKEMVKVLQAFAEICQKHGIRWWLCSGTLLGAARHGGFIPWDDDIDVSMLKKDRRKLEKVLRKLDSDDYFYQCIRTDVEHVNLFGFFRKKEGNVPSTNPRALYFKYKGVGLDVFSIEKSSRFAAHMAKFFYLNMQHPTQYIRNKTLRHVMIRIVEALNICFFLPLTRMVGLINPKNQYHYVLGSGFYRSAFYAEDIFPLSTMDFEGIPFPVPGNTDAYLTKIYGDWRSLPSEEKIKVAMHSPLYKEEIFGRHA